MISNVRRLSMLIALLLSLCAPLAVWAQMSAQESKTAQGMVSGTLYLRLDVPLRSEVGHWGLGSEPLLEVSPTGHDSSRLINREMKNKEMTETSRWRMRERINWVFFPNYPVRYGKLTVKGNTVEVFLEGVQPNYEVRIDFIQIDSLADFTKAFNQTFSNVPLQDEHPEWPAEIRNAIAEHRLVVGMTTEQAFDVVGTPLDVKTDDASGVHTEIWHPRQDKGKVVVVGYVDAALGSTGFPAQLKFIDGKLQVIG
ncbi:MAG: hypothetical protein ACLQBK_16815 [Candidatus Sulfotelmatobacter sp.]